MKWRVNEMSDKFSPVPFSVVEESRTVVVNESSTVGRILGIN